MGAAYTICGVLIGVAVSKASASEPSWGALCIPAVIAFFAGLIAEHSK